MLQLCSQHSLHPEVLEVLGSGVIEWRRDRDRHAHLHSATVTQTGTSVKPAELLKLVAVMVRQQLPLHYKVTVEGLSDI